MKRSYIIAAILGSAALGTPGIALPIGDYYASHIQTGNNQDKVKNWRNARMAYRTAQFSPFYIQAAKTKMMDIDFALSKNMFSIVMMGSSEKFNQTEHMRFLSSRENSPFWNRELANSQIRYGEAEEALLTLESLGNPSDLQTIGLSAALLSSDKKALSMWLSKGSHTATGLYFYVDESPSEDSHISKVIQAHKAPNDTNWNDLYDSMADQFKSVVAEAHARSSSPDTLLLTEWIDSNAAESNWGCAKLAAAPHLQDRVEALISSSVAELRKGPRYLPRISVAANISCHPDVVSQAADLTIIDENAAWLNLFAAQGYLGQLDLYKAKDTIKKLSADGLTTEQKTFYYQLRTLEREMAGDLGGVERYARQGAALDTNVFTPYIGKSALLKTEKSSATWLLHGHDIITPPEELAGVYKDLCAVAERVDSDAGKIILNGKEIPYGLWERSSEFRVWFSEHLNSITTLPPTPSPALSILVNNPRSKENGDFLMTLFTATQVHPLNVALRAQYDFLFNMWRPQGAKQNRWKQLESARVWLSELPYPQLLRLSPESFIVNLTEA